MESNQLLPNDVASDTLNTSTTNSMISNATNHGSTEENIDTMTSMPMYKHYKFRNLLCFNFSGFFCIAFVIFLTSSQPFFIHQYLHLGDNKIGKIIGLLGVIDEVTSLITSPLIGSLNDKINTTTAVINGSKIIIFLSFTMIAVSFFTYALVEFDNWHQFILPRIIFSIGVTSCMSMIPVLLNQLIYSDFKFSKIFYWKPRSTNINVNSNLTKNGKYSSMIGITTGLGAIFSVSCFLTLPVRLSVDFNLTTKDGIKLSFLILGCCSILISLFMLGFLYNSPTLPKFHTSYFNILISGWNKFLHDSNVQIACLGGFIARSTSVLIAVFIPLYVYNYYYGTGLCDADGFPSKTNCYDGYIFSAILTGICQTIGLLSSPFWGLAIDKFGKKNCLLISSIFGIIGNSLIVVFKLYDPTLVWSFLLISLIGISQIGTIITSMSLISMENDVVGSISGIYNLFGGLGILLLNQFGGMWSDYYILSPFLIMGIFNGILIWVVFLKVCRG